MSEHGHHEKRVILFTAAATAGLGVAAFELMRRHLRDGDQVVVKGVAQEALQEVDSRLMMATDEPEIPPHIVYVGPGDPILVAEGAKEVYGLDLTEDDHRRFGDRILHVFRDFRHRQ